LPRWPPSAQSRRETSRNSSAPASKPIRLENCAEQVGALDVRAFSQRGNRRRDAADATQGWPLSSVIALHIMNVGWRPGGSMVWSCMYTPRLNLDVDQLIGHLAL
jgi:hypothetical protein